MRKINFKKTVNPNLQKHINKSIIFNFLRENGPVYRAKISNKLNISAPAVSRAIEELIDDGYVIESEKIRTGSGKRPTKIIINSEKGLIVGIDLQKERIKIAVTDFNGKILNKYHGFSFYENIDVEKKIVEEVENILSVYKQENNSKNQSFELKAICIGMPAIIDVDTGMVINAPLYDNLEGLNLKNALSDRFNVPTYVENIAKISALGEKKYGEGKNYKNIVFIEVSNGIGAGIIVDNYLLRGTYGAAGEIGSTIINSENLSYKRKNKGFLEKYASVESIKEIAIEEIEKQKKTLILDLVNNEVDKIKPSIVCKAAIKGDKVASNIITEMVKFLSIAIIDLILILDPEIVVLGGDICNLPEKDKLFLRPIEEIIKNAIPFEIPKIRFSSLGEDAGIIGASILAIETLLVGEFPYTIDHATIS